MRIPSGVTTRSVYFYAVDSTDFTTPETGLSSFTVYRSRDGGAAAAMTTPTISETSPVNMAGVYEILLDEDMTIAATSDSEEITFHIAHAGMAHVVRTIDLYRRTVETNETISATSGAVDTVTTNTDMRGTDGAITSVAGLSTFNPAVTAVITDTASRDASKADVSGLSTFNPATDAVANVTLVATTSTNTDMRGTDSAATATNLAIVDTNVDSILVDTDTTIPSLISALNDLSSADILTTALTESYSADGAAPTLSQALFLIQQFLYERVVDGTVVTVAKLDGSTTAATATLNDGTAPTSITRAT